jgi:hypothetical protein
VSLKLEKDLKSKRILLSVKPKTADYCQRLALAFLIASSLHLMAFTLFRINLGNFFSIDTVPPVSFVSTDSRSLAIAWPGVEKEELDMPSYLQITRATTPPIPFFLELALREEIQSPFRPDFGGFLPENKTALCKSKWHFSKGSFLPKDLPELTCEGERKGSFAFRLQDVSIVWTQMLQSTGNPKLDLELEESLKRLYLVSGAREGVVEVEFLP